MAKFDVYIAKVWFAEFNGFRNRPVVQIKASPYAPDSFAMISTTEKDMYDGDVLIQDIHAAGLKNSDKRNRVRLAERMDFPKTLATRKPIGRLSKEDAQNVLKALYTPHKIKKHYAEDLDDDFTLTHYIQNRGYS